MLEEEFVPYLERRGVLERSYFMQDGATPHTSDASLDVLWDHFEERVISRRYMERYACGLTWPSYSPDLTPCDFFLWGFLKSRVYFNRPITKEELMRNIRHEANNIPLDVLTKTMGNFEKRLKSVRVANGRHIEGRYV